MLLELLRKSAHGVNTDVEVVRGSAEERRLATEVDSILENQERAADLMGALFPEGIPNDTTFYARLYNVWFNLGRSDLANRGIGLLWVVALQQLSRNSADELLNLYLVCEQRAFLAHMASLGVLLEYYELPPALAAGWLPSILQRIGLDGVAPDFTDAITAFCEKRPKVALAALAHLNETEEEPEAAIAGQMLGVLRTIQKDSAFATDFTNTESKFANAPTLKPRSVYNRSWILTARLGKMLRSDFEALINRIAAAKPNEQDESYWIVCACARTCGVLSDCFSFGIDWLRANVTSSISANAKCQVAYFAAFCGQEKRWEAGDLLVAIQPIPVEHKGTWRHIEGYLVHLLKADSEEFEEFFLKLSERNPDGLFAVARPLGSFEWLFSEMRGKDLNGLVGKLVLSRDSASRRLGLFIFEDLELITIPPALFTDANEVRLRIAFYESQMVFVGGRAIALFLISFIPHLHLFNQEFHDDFYRELVLQSKNYGGSCREEFEKRMAEYSLLQKALDEAKRYFDEIRRLREANTCLMQVTGYGRALRLLNRRFSNQVSKGTEDLFPLLRMMKNTPLLYGKRWRSYVGSNLGEVSELHSISTSQEFPRLEEIDPEGMAILRLGGAHQIAELSKSLEARA